MSRLKVCSRCKNTKDIDSFGVKKSSKDGRNIWCRSCCNEYNSEYRKKNPQKIKNIKAKHYQNNKAAAAEYAKRKREENPELFKERSDSYHERNPLAKRIAALKIKSMTIESYNEILQKQNFVCAICDEPDPSGKNLHVDHDHNCCAGVKSCGKCVRGLLCGICNRALGGFKDDADILLSAIDYLRGANSGSGPLLANRINYLQEEYSWHPS